jgi:DNA-binding NarL/FixJ family response regulator
LTPRQLTALEAAARCGSYKAAAADLGCAIQTVKTHVSDAIKRLGVFSCTSAAVYAVERGWIRNVTIDLETKWLVYAGGLEGVQDAI